MKYDETVVIKANARVNAKYFKLVFRSPRLASGVLPGQFLHVQIQSSLDPFLRRPFSYYRTRRGMIEVLYEVMGRGTEILSHLGPGDRLRVMGPLGRPFSRRLRRKKRILVAGGVGVPPLVFLAEKTGCEALLIGTRSRREVLSRAELRNVRGPVLYTTEDGSFGRQGYVTLLLREILEKENPGQLFIQTCGPTPMMKAVAAMAAEYGVEGEASMEENMACGVGACLGCMVRTEAGWVPSCTEGPVFAFSSLREFAE